MKRTTQEDDSKQNVDKDSGSKPVSKSELEKIFSRIIGAPVHELPFEFYERDGEVVAHQDRQGFIEQEKWFKIYNYTLEAGGRAEKDEELGDWYFTFLKPAAELEPKPAGLPLHPQKSPPYQEKPPEAEEPEATEEGEEEYDLKDSVSKVGRLYPVLVDAHGNVIDGYHRLEADPDWPKHKVKDVTDPVQLTIARLIANICRRDVPREEKTKYLRELAELTGWTPKQIADNIPLSYRWVIEYIPDEYKEKSWDGEPIARLAIKHEPVKKHSEKPSETEDLTEKQKKPNVPCELCGKPTSNPFHLKGKNYCEDCTEKALAKPEAAEEFKAPEEFEAEEPEEPRIPVPSTEGEEKEKNDVLDHLRRGMAAAEWVLEDKYGFDPNRGLETYKISEIKRLVEENEPTNQFLKDLRECVDLHKKFYAAYHGMEEFAPLENDVATENIGKIDGYLKSEELKKVKPVDLEAKGRVCPFCGRVMDADAFERHRMDRKVLQRVREAFKIEF